MSDYLKGIYIDEKESKWGSYQHASIHLETFIKALKELPLSDKGYVSFAISRQKDPKKFSCKPYKPSATPPVSNVATTQFGEQIKNTATDDLPF